MRRREEAAEVLGELIRTFFPDYLRLVETEIAGRLDLDRVRCLDPPGQGAGPDGVEVIAEVPLLGEKEILTVLVRIELEALPEREAALRLRRSLEPLGVCYGRPVLVSVVYLKGGRPGIQLESGVVARAAGIELMRLYYSAFGLERSRAEYFLARPEPLAWALAAFMSPVDRAPEEHARACLERIGTAPLDECRRDLLRRAALTPAAGRTRTGCPAPAGRAGRRRRPDATSSDG